MSAIAATARLNNIFATKRVVILVRLLGAPPPKFGIVTLQF